MGSINRDINALRAGRKLKKRKLAEAIPDLPGDLDASEVQDTSHPIAGNGKKKRKLEESSHDGGARMARRAPRESEVDTDEIAKSNRKTKDPEDNSIGSSADLKILRRYVEGESQNVGDNASQIEDGQPARKTKKERKAARKAAKTTQAAVGPEPIPPSVEDFAVAGGGEVPLEKAKKNNMKRDGKQNFHEGDEVLEKAEGKSSRFIVFIGNLPFSTTTGSIYKHFAAVHPKSIRHLTKKDEPDKSRGCAFLEFEGYDHMKACLKSFHHSTFDDGISPARKINVELTAGGGGKKQNRKNKIGEKNQKLNEQRTRRIREDEKAKIEKRSLAIDHSDVHPSRRARVPDTS